MDPYVSFKKSKGSIGFFVVLSMCGDHERSSLMLTPRHFVAEALSSSTLCKIYLVFKSLTFLVMWRTWHSSAKSLTLDLTCSCRALMYARKRIGPRTEPCGTPEETGTSSELIPLITTVCFRLYKKSLIHLKVSPLMPS